MRITITDRLVSRTAQEGSAIAFAVSVFTDTAEPWTAATPTTLRYRVDDLNTGCTILDWTTLTPASTATITVPGSSNMLSTCSPSRRQLVVEANHGLDTGCISTREYRVRSLLGVAA